MWSIYNDAVHYVNNKQPLGDSLIIKIMCHFIFIITNINIECIKYDRIMATDGSQPWLLEYWLSCKGPFCKEGPILLWNQETCPIFMNHSCPLSIFSLYDHQYATFWPSWSTFYGWALSIWGDSSERQPDDRRLVLFPNFGGGGSV